jgi:hypothetical protein
VGISNGSDAGLSPSDQEIAQPQVGCRDKERHASHNGAFRVNSKNEIREPDLIAMPRMTTLALAPIAVRFPPKSAPIASDHHRASACTGSAMPWVSWSTIGLMAAV